MRRWIITVLGSLTASWPLAALAQELMPPTRAATPNVPQIKSLRLKRVDLFQDISFGWATARLTC